MFIIHCMVLVNVNNNRLWGFLVKFGLIESSLFPPLINMSEIEGLQRTGERI